MGVWSMPYFSDYSRAALPAVTHRMRIKQEHLHPRHVCRETRQVGLHCLEDVHVGRRELSESERHRCTISATVGRSLPSSKAGVVRVLGESAAVVKAASAIARHTHFGDDVAPAELSGVSAGSRNAVLGICDRRAAMARRRGTRVGI